MVDITLMIKDICNRILSEHYDSRLDTDILMGNCRVGQRGVIEGGMSWREGESGERVRYSEF